MSRKAYNLTGNVMQLDTILATGFDCRCPSCKKPALRGIRTTDSQYMSLCPNPSCGPRMLTDIEQPTPQRLTDETYAALCKDGKTVDDRGLPREAIHTGKDGIQPRKRTRPAPPIEGGRYPAGSIQEQTIAAMIDLVARYPEKTHPEICDMLGLSRQLFKNILNSYKRDGLGNKQCLRLLKSYGAEPHDLPPAAENQTPSRARPPAPPPVPDPDAFDPSDETQDPDPDIAKAWALQLLQDTLGIDLEELEALRIPIEQLALCRRNRIPCRLVIDDIEVR